MEPLDKLQRLVGRFKIGVLNLRQFSRLLSTNPRSDDRRVFFNPRVHSVNDNGKPTVGPWCVQVSGKNRYIESVRASRGVAAVMWSPESEANARLLAAAPELLTECIYVLSLLERGDMNGLKDEVPHLRLLVDRVRNGDDLGMNPEIDLSKVSKGADPSPGVGDT